MKQHILSVTFLITLVAPFSNSIAKEIPVSPCACQYYIPNAFSPNQDGFNDIFLPFFSSACSVSSYKIKIYNRWGALVFESDNPQNGWNGKFSGEDAPQGVYMYTITYIEPGDSTPEPLTISGSLTLLR